MFWTGILVGMFLGVFLGVLFLGVFWINNPREWDQTGRLN